MVSLQDFSRVGDTAVFIDQPTIDLLEQQMMERGYLDSREMSNMFNLLRSNDLIWSNVVNNYLMGEKPAAFDLLYWNSDGTRMCRAAHSWYLRNTYVENNLIIDPALIILIMRRSGTADAGRWRGSAAAVWTGCAYAGPQLASAVPCCALAPGAGAPASSPRSRLHPD
jgi:polyhydroxyalkanoate synthase subunit PhaC